MNSLFSNNNRRKVVILGDENIGKTSVVNVYRTGIFLEGFVPSISEYYAVDRKIDKKDIVLMIWDTLGRDDHEEHRLSSYSESHVFLIFFSVNSPESLLSVEMKWTPEVLHFRPNTPYILVGCKTDLRQDARTLEELEAKGSRVVSKEEGETAARKIGAKMYMECSAKRGEGLSEVFIQATRTSFATQVQAKHSHCVIS